MMPALRRSFALAALAACTAPSAVGRPSSERSAESFAEPPAAPSAAQIAPQGRSWAGQEPPCPNGGRLHLVDAMNPNGAVSTACGGTDLAIEYVPSRDYSLVRIDFHTNGHGFVVLADDHGRPGEILATGTGRPTGEGRWNAAQLSQPLPVRAGTRYWLGKPAGDCSNAASGEHPRYYGSFHGWSGPWEGPHQGLAYVWRLYACY